MSKTISSSITGPVTLGTADNPLTITSTGTVTSTGSLVDGIDGAAPTVWTIGNDGTVTSSGGNGVSLASAGTIANGPSSGSAALVSGYLDGIYVGGIGIVTNSGSIAGTGTSSSGVSLGAGGTITNAAGGAISGFQAIAVAGGYGTVTNAGGITQSGSSTGSGVALHAGGSITNAATGTISATGDAVYIGGGTVTGTVTNAGSITASGTGFSGIGFEVGGSVTNTASAFISGGGSGIDLSQGGTVTNSGIITGTALEGVDFSAGGSIANAASASISGGVDGVLISGTGTVANYGTISGTAFAGIDLQSGSLTNAAGASISGGTDGVYMALGGATVTNDGTVSGGTDAVKFGNSAANRLIVDPAAVFIGAVVGGATSASNVLELDSGSGTITGFSGGAGTVTENGHSWSLANFGTIALASGATLDVEGTLSNTAGSTFDLGGAGTQTLTLGADASGGQGGSFAPAITDFGIGDKVEIGGFTPPVDPMVVYDSIANTLTVESDGSVDYTFDDVVASSGVTNFVAGTDLSTGDVFAEAACFLAGTRLATPAGGVAVEDLRVGDRVVTESGKTAPVVWIGQRRVDCRRHPRPWVVQPVRIRAGAFADGLPQRDLLLSPDHAVFAEGVLIPVKYLANGLDILQESAWRAHYFHVELGRHDIVLAEGLPAESYLDTGNRSQFENGAAHMALHPDFSPLSWDDACAPLCLAGPVVAAVRRRLRDRAEALGYLEVAADGRVVRSAAMRGRMHRFLLPRGTREVRVGSRMGIGVANVFVGGRCIPPPDREGWSAMGEEARLALPFAPFRRGPVLLELLLRDPVPAEERAAAEAA